MAEVWREHRLARALRPARCCAGACARLNASHASLGAGRSAGKERREQALSAAACEGRLGAAGHARFRPAARRDRPCRRRSDRVRRCASAATCPTSRSAPTRTRARETLEGVARPGRHRPRPLLRQRSTARTPPAISPLIRDNGGQRLDAGHRPQSDDGGSRHRAVRRWRSSRRARRSSSAFRPPGWRSSLFRQPRRKPRPAPAISKPS